MLLVRCLVVYVSDVSLFVCVWCLLMMSLMFDVLIVLV